MEMLLLTFLVGFALAALLLAEHGNQQTQPEIRYTAIDTEQSSGGGCMPTVVFAMLFVLVAAILGKL
jgi:hypothetical protein